MKVIKSYIKLIQAKKNYQLTIYAEKITSVEQAIFFYKKSYFKAKKRKNGKDKTMNNYT